ncbi:hypothetical protein BX591_1573 [Paraburkholderia bryophila]|uniref:Uncharacterized protein n=1 Tax=Paraburkholderia bryophila TaxID=420952 RepID=A0A329B5J1_9BURK|nr:hypothetical protein BX591_1573 [Paraburkholderia bryophila]
MFPAICCTACLTSPPDTHSVGLKSHSPLAGRTRSDQCTTDVARPARDYSLSVLQKRQANRRTCLARPTEIFLPAAARRRRCILRNLYDVVELLVSSPDFTYDDAAKAIGCLSLIGRVKIDSMQCGYFSDAFSRSASVQMSAMCVKASKTRRSTSATSPALSEFLVHRQIVQTYPIHFQTRSAPKSRSSITPATLTNLYQNNLRNPLESPAQSSTAWE